MAKRVSPRRVGAAHDRFTVTAAEFNALRESVQELRDELRLQFKRIAQIQVELDTIKHRCAKMSPVRDWEGGVRHEMK